MNEQNKNINLSKNACIDYDTMKAYLRNELSNTEMHKVEQHLIVCDFCANAFDGLNEQKELEKQFVTIDKLKKEITEKAKKTKVLKPHTKRPFVYAAIAASIAILFGLNFIFSNSNTKPNLAEEKTKINNNIAENKITDSLNNKAMLAEKTKTDSSKTQKTNNNIKIKPEQTSSQLAKNNTTTNKKENLIHFDSISTPKNTEIADASTKNENETELNDFKIDEPEETADIEVYNPNKATVTRTLGKEKNTSNKIATPDPTNTYNLLKLIDKKTEQKDYSAALNIIYQLEHSKDAQKLKLKLTLKRAEIFALQFNKTMAVQFLQSVKDKEITDSKEYKDLLKKYSN